MKTIDIGLMRNLDEDCFNWSASSIIPKTGEVVSVGRGVSLETCFRVVEVIYLLERKSPTVKLLVQEM